jgi:hypothetical protein
MLKFEITFDKNHDLMLSYCRHGAPHRNNGAAAILYNGDQYWYQYGKCHRDNAPAITYANGYQAWYYKGKLHRTDGPAIMYANGSQYWYHSMNTGKYEVALE